MGFTHLNLASAYSAHYGVNRPEQLAAAASALGFEALAVTDRDGLYGAVKPRALAAAASCSGRLTP